MIKKIWLMIFSYALEVMFDYWAFFLRLSREKKKRAITLSKGINM